MRKNNKGKKITGVVPWPAVLAPGDEVAKVIAKPPFNLVITKSAMSVKRGLLFFGWGRSRVDKGRCCVDKGHGKKKSNSW